MKLIKLDTIQICTSISQQLVK